MVLRFFQFKLRQLITILTDFKRYKLPSFESFFKLESHVI